MAGMSLDIDVVAVHDRALGQWYGPAGAPGELAPGEELLSLVLAQHSCNFGLWNLEDEARRRDVDDSVIAEVKRQIDGWNQRRNDRVELIDEFLLADLADSLEASAPLHSETAGMMIDRLSILSLKIHHMGLNAARDDDPELGRECAGKLEVLIRQRGDLADCLQQLLSDCRQGRRRFQLYRQYKAYNDERLNPALR